MLLAPTPISAPFPKALPISSLACILPYLSIYIYKHTCSCSKYVAYLWAFKKNLSDMMLHCVYYATYKFLHCASSLNHRPHTLSLSVRLRLSPSEGLYNI